MALASCGGGQSHDGVTAPSTASFKPVLSWLKVSVSPLNLEVGRTGTATAQAFDQNGGPFDTDPLTFTSSAPAIASVDAAGVIRGIAPGSAVITAAVGGKAASHNVTVIPVRVARVVVSPEMVILDPGAFSTFVASLFDAEGAKITGRAVGWSSSDTTIAVISATGRLTARSAGRAKITATSDERFATSIVTVTGDPGAVGDLLIRIGRPMPGELVADALDVSVSVASSRPLVRVEAHLEGATLELAPHPVGFYGLQTLWKGTLDISLLHFGEYYVVVTATDGAATATDSALFERDPVKKSGGTAGAGKKNKLVAPVVLPRPARGSVKGKP